MKSVRARILHVEDDADNRDLISFVLTNHDCDWVGAATHGEALRLAKEGGYNLYLLDSWLPDDSGLDLCKRIREFDIKTPILFYSAAAAEKDKHTAITNGAQGYLTKPSDPGDLMSEVFRLMTEFPT